MLKLILAIAVILFIIVIGPILTIWALNTLFPVLAIGYTIESWFAVVLLGAFIKGKVTVNK